MSKQPQPGSRKYEELKAQLEQLQAQQAKQREIEFRVSGKGGVSVYGLGRFPVTLYYEQWMALLANAKPLKEFLETNKKQLKMKGDK